MNRSVPFIVTGLLALLPAQASHAASKPSTSKPKSKSTSKTTSKPVTHSYTGQPVDMEWGTVQVWIKVQGKKIIDVQASAPTERPRSAFINQQAVPWLRQETLQAQSANIDLISGATMTSEAFGQSLQDALQQAHLA